MSEHEHLPAKPATNESTESSKGPNLALIYGLIGIALLVAMVIAGFIVLPFYHRR